MTEAGLHPQDKQEPFLKKSHASLVALRDGFQDPQIPHLYPRHQAPCIQECHSISIDHISIDHLHILNHMLGLPCLMQQKCHEAIIRL